MSDVYRVQAKEAKEQDLDLTKLCSKVSRFLATIESALSNASSKASTSDTIARQPQNAIDRVVYGGNLIEKSLVKDAYRVLCEGTPILAEEGTDNIETPWETYAGKYRTVHVGAGSTMFTPPQFVERQMRELIHELNTELEEALAHGTLDPFAFAVKYSMKFVQIHPFQDGNGHFAGIVVPIEETKEDRGESIRIKRTASEDAADHGEYATFVLAKSESRLRAIKKKLAVSAKQ
ncbi:hypothetical protein Sste5346_000436 [Sporothrix stenoceras]|uniref:Fido domain-containing protein n=1 Tax=Sporothrix stenoceras TaxID=5173 RepID=A0ABR3ZSL7_9PEZI